MRQVGGSGEVSVNAKYKNSLRLDLIGRSEIKEDGQDNAKGKIGPRTMIRCSSLSSFQYVLSGIFLSIL